MAAYRRLAGGMGGLAVAWAANARHSHPDPLAPVAWFAPATWFATSPNAVVGRTRRFKDAELRHAGRRNLVLFVLAQAAALVYLGWLVTAIDWTHRWMGGAFLLAEVICAVSVFLWGEMLARKRLHPPEGLTWRGDPPPVDVLIAVYGEPFEVVRPTFDAVAKIDYPHFRVTVLDDGRSAEIPGFGVGRAAGPRSGIWRPPTASTTRAGSAGSQPRAATSTTASPSRPRPSS